MLIDRFYTHDDGRHWFVSFEPSGPEGHTTGTLVFRSGSEERRVPCRDDVGLLLAEGRISEGTLANHFERSR